MSEYNLLTPGPVPMPPEVYKALCEPMTHHRIPAFNAILEKCFAELKKIFLTQNPVFIQTTTGSGSMESAVVNTLSFEDEVLVIVNGKFGERWRDICLSYNLKRVHTLNLEWGKAVEAIDIENYILKHPDIKAVLMQHCETSTGVLNPLERVSNILKRFPNVLLIVDAITSLGAAELKMDEWGIDVVCAGSQKAFMMPTGLSFISLSKKAWARCEKANLPRYYLDLRLELKAQSNGQTFFSTAISHVKALSAYFDYLNSKGGLSFSLNRCNSLANATRLALEAFNLKLFTDSPSPSLTTVMTPLLINSKKLRQHIEDKYSVIIMEGQDQLSGKILRIGHLGYIKNSNLIAGIESIGQSLIEFGHNINLHDIEKAKSHCLNALREDA